MKNFVILFAICTSFFVQHALAQGDYKNMLPTYTTPSTGNATPVDFETITNNIIVTGMMTPLDNSIPGITNPNSAQRIFLTDFITGGYTFNYLYLIVGVDIPKIKSDFVYTVKEVKYDGNGYVVCGNIVNTTATSYFNEAFILRADINGIYQWFYRYKVNYSNSTFFNSIEPIYNGNTTTGYLTCGYFLDSIDIKRAIVMRVDTVGQIIGVKKLNEGTVSGYHQHSEYKKVINYNNYDFALTGYCSQVPDGCGKHFQSNILFSMYNLSANSITGKSYRSNGMSALDNNVDEGVSLVKIDSGLVVLSQYYDNNGLACTDLPDIIGNILWINPVTPTLNTSWVEIKDLKYNPDATLPSIDYPKDLLYDANSGANRHLWIYNNYNINTGSLLKMNLNTATNLITPKNMNNNAGYSVIDGKTIDYNTGGNVLGLTNFYSYKYSIFEITNSSDSTCHSDSLYVPYEVDSLFEAYVNHDSIDAIATLLKHKAYAIPLDIEYYCDSVSAKPSPGSSANISTNAEVEIFPNPTGGVATLSLFSNKNGMANIFITDILGHRVSRNSSMNLVSGFNYIPIDISRMALGIYFCIVELNGKKTMLKILKE